MAGVTTDIHTVEYGIPDSSGQLVAYPVGAAVQLYSGSVALIAGTGSVTTQGYLKSAVTGSASDTVVGITGDPAGGTSVQLGPGILGGSADGNVWANVRTGAFFIQSGTGSNALSATTNGKTVYYGGENSVGPIANATQGTSPILGVQLPQDPGIAGTVSPGSNYFPIKLNVVGGP